MLVRVRSPRRSRGREGDLDWLASASIFLHPEVWRAAKSVFRGEPPRQISHVASDVDGCASASLQPVPGGLGHEGRAAKRGVPVVVGKVVETRFRYRAAESIPLRIDGPVERDDEVELPSGRLAAPLGDRAGARIARRSSDRPFMGVRGEEFDPS